MKRHAPYIAVIAALAGALGWLGTSYLSQQSRIEELKAANLRLGTADQLIGDQVREIRRASLAKIPATCANLMAAGSHYAPVRIRTPEGEFELTRVK
jgi:hypothetical protein